MRNPFTTNPPRLSPTKRRSFSRSPSRSPTRQHDPLLRDLSPSTTLRAFVTQADEPVPTGADSLVRSIQASSHSERALGATAAQIGLDVRSWTRELEGWEWPGTFETPSLADRAMLRMSAITYDSILSHHTANSATSEDEAVEYWGSLPVKTVQMYDLRADEIGRQLDEIDVEELKDYLLSSHYRPASRPTSMHGDLAWRSPADLKHLDDYTAVVTATILQALPYLSKLHQLLDTWTLRLTVLRAAPAYLRDLKHARTDLDHGWAAIAVSPNPSRADNSARFGRDNMREMKDVIGHQVTSLGARLDRFLDDLEGRDETIPASWIDDFEGLESAYGEWVVRAERKVLENEWRDSHAPPATAAHIPEEIELPAEPVEVSSTEDPALDNDAVVTIHEPTPVHLVEHTDGGTIFLLDADEEMRQKPTLPQPSPVQPSAPSEFADFQFDAGLADEQSPPQSSHDVDPVTETSPPVSSSPGLAKKRAAAFLAEIDRKPSLKQSKSPVRPFERATDAFTRLFKKERPAEHTRSRSLRSVNDKSDAASGRDGVEGRKSVSDVYISSPRLIEPSIKRNTIAAAGTVALPPALETPEPVELPGDMPSELFVTDTALLEPRTAAHDLARPATATRQITPETYKPTGYRPPSSGKVEEQHDEQHDEPDFPENWPLVSPSDTPARQSLADGRAQETVAFDEDATSGVVLDQPASPLSTDEFDLMLAHSFPSKTEDTTAGAPEEVRISTSPARRPVTLSRTSSSLGSEPSFRRAPRMTYLDNVAVRRPPTSASSRPGHAQQLEDALLNERLLTPGSSGSNPQSPESQDARADYFKGASSSPSRPISRMGHVRDETRYTSPSTPPEPLVLFESLDGQPVVPSLLPEDQSEVELMQPASVLSIVTPSRSEVKRVDISKSPASPTGADATPSSPTSLKGLMSFPTPPPRTSSLRKRPTSPVVESPSVHPNGLRSHPVSGGSPFASRAEPAGPPLNAAMAKQRRRKEDRRPASPVEAASRKASSHRPGEDTFDRHVSEVLEKLPAGIKFRSRAGAETPVPGGNEARGAGGLRVKTGGRAVRRSSGMTIAPAEASPKKPSTASEPEVKLYHLTQAGRDEPIKLFVRLVGEGERVMVRVGGGWADLADYLRQYAEHHGSRTVSEGALEVQTFTGNRRVSGPADVRTKAAAAPFTPTSAVSSRPASRDGDGQDWLSKPQPKFSMGDSDDTSPEEDTAPNGTPLASPGVSTSAAALAAAEAAATPKSPRTPTTPTGRSSRPPTSDSVVTTTATGGGGGGGGAPSSATKRDLSDHKAKWVEGMIERAKASAEKSRDDAQQQPQQQQRFFGELGKTGATRRVVFHPVAAGAAGPSDAAVAAAVAAAVTGGAGEKGM